MCMTKKHFEAIARVISTDAKLAFKDLDANPQDSFAAGKLYALRSVAGQFARLAARDKPRFDPLRFLRACGVNRD